jgi:soluble lytic murein transglycosylase-like protein
MKQEKSSTVGYAIFAWALVTTIIMILAYREVWQRGAQIKRLDAQVETLRADKAELAGELQDLQGEGEYFKKYSFQLVMGLLIKKARQYEIPINTALALLQIESGFNPFAVSSTGDFGFFQMNEKAHKFDKQKIFDPEINIDMGLAYLQKCYKQAGSWSMALSVYNAGKNYEQSDHPRKFSESIFIK